MMITALSQDGSMVAMVLSSPSTRLSIPCFQVASSQLQCTLVYSTAEPCRKLLFMNDFLCALFTTKIVIWDLSRSVVCQTIDIKNDGTILLDVQVSSDDVILHALMQTPHKKLMVMQYKASSGKCLVKIKCGHVHKEEEEGDCKLATYKDEIAAVSIHNKIKLVSLKDGSKIGKIKANAKVISMDFMKSKDETLVLAVATSTAVHFYKANAAKQELLTSVHLATQPTKIATSGNKILVETSKENLLYSLTTTTTTSGEDATLQTTLTCPQEGTKVSLEMTKDDADKIVAVLHQAGSNNNNKNKTVVQEVEYLDSDGAVSKTSIELTIAQQDNEKNDDVESSKKKRNSTCVLGPGQAGGEALGLVDGEPQTKRHKSNKEEEDEEDESIAQRLQKLTQAMLQEEQEEEEEETADTNTASIDFVAKKASTESLIHLLGQALQSGNDSMLELALGVRDVNVLKNTLQALPHHQIQTLFTKLTTRLASKPNRAHELNLWLRLVLESGKLASTRHLMPLRNLLQERIESFPHLLRLEGRLSLLGKGG